MLAQPVSVDEAIDIHLGMKTKELDMESPYMEVVKETGDRAATNVAQQGIDPWLSRMNVPTLPPISHRY